MTEMKVMMIKFMQRYSNLEEPEATHRRLELQLTHHLTNSTAILTKKMIEPQIY
jgi:hypothetical protein